MSHAALILTDNVTANAGRRTLGGMLRHVLARLMEREVRRLSRKAPPVGVLTGTDLAARLGPAIGAAVVRDWDTDSETWLNRAAFGVLHDFTDRLCALTAPAGAVDGLAFHGVPALKVLETRWLDALFSTLLVYGDVVSAAMDELRPDSLHLLTGESAIESLGAMIARSKGIRVTRGGAWSAPPLRALTRLASPDYGDPYRSMVRRELAELPDEADTSAFEQVDRPLVLFVGSVNRTVERLLAAMPAISSRLDCRVGLMATSRVTLADRLREAGVICSPTHAWLNARDGAEIVDRARVRGKNVWHSLATHADALSTVTWQGAPIYPSAAPLVKAVCTDGAPRAAMITEIAARVIEKARPAVLVNFEDGDINRAFTYICRERKIPTLAYYTLSPDSCSGLIRRSQEWLAVCGSYLQRSFSPQFPPDRIRIVGDSLTDRVALLSKDEARRKLCSRLGLNADRPIIVLFSTYPNSHMRLSDLRVLFERCFAGARQIPGAQVVVKGHPLQSLDSVEAWMRDWDCRAPLIQDWDTLELSLAADLVCAPLTAAVWMAMMAGTPVVSIQPREILEQFEDLGYDFLKGKGVRYIDPSEDPTPVFTELLFDPAARQAQIARGTVHVSEHVGPLDGQASHRFADFLADVLASQGAGSPDECRPSGPVADVPGRSAGPSLESI